MKHTAALLLRRPAAELLIRHARRILSLLAVLSLVFVAGATTTASAQTGSTVRVTEALCEREHSAPSGAFITTPFDSNGDGTADTCALANYFGTEPGVGTALKRLQDAHPNEYTCHLLAVRAGQDSNCDFFVSPPSQTDSDTEEPAESSEPEPGSSTGSITAAVCRAEHSAPSGAFITTPFDSNGDGTADTCALANYFGTEPGVGTALKRLQDAHPNEYTCHLLAVRASQDSPCTPIASGASPEWSPDGTQIAYSNLNGIYVVNADGTGNTQLADHPDAGRTSEPVWSPDGTRIAYNVREGNDKQNPTDLDESFQSFHGVYVVNADGTNNTRIASGSAPVWSPDGTHITYLVHEGGGHHGSTPRALAVVNADGTGNTEISRTGQIYGHPAWSPDGTRIAYNGRDGIYLVNPDGTGRTLLRVNGSSYLSWSPDGTRIAYQNVWEGFYVINTDGTGQRRIADEPDPFELVENHSVSVIMPNNGGVSWSPDGTRIAWTNAWAIPQAGTYTSDFYERELPNYGHQYGVFVVNADGSGMTLLAESGEAASSQPDWSPDGSHIVFQLGDIYVVFAP